MDPAEEEETGMVFVVGDAKIGSEIIAICATQNLGHQVEQRTLKTPIWRKYFVLD
jgi:hypothetical protein